MTEPFIRVRLDDLLEERGMTLTELSHRLSYERS